MKAKVGNIREPDFNLPQDVRAFLNNEFGCCGCSEIDEMIKTLIEFLEWHQSDKAVSYKALFAGNLGVYYLLAGVVDRAGLSEHGSSIRYPFLSKRGEKLLEGLKMFKPEEIESENDTATIAYDGTIYQALQ